MKTCVVFVSLLTVVSAAGAGPKPPWQWTDEERLTARFDPRAIAERQAASPAARAVPREKTANRQRISYVIDGKRNPELFMRYELFDELVRGALVSTPRKDMYRRSLESDLRRIGLPSPETFWPALEDVSRSYLTLYERLAAAHTGWGRDGHRELCRERFAALNAARQRFGNERFDSFLYTAIAPYMVQSSATTDASAAEHLRREAEGCK